MINTNLEQALFSIDNCFDLRERMRFERYLDQHVARGLIPYVDTGVGSYKGTLEICYLMEYLKFIQCVVDMPWVYNQECYAKIPGNSKQPVTLWTFKQQYLDNPGPVRRAEGKPDTGNWTMINNQYWVF